MTSLTTACGKTLKKKALNETEVELFALKPKQPDNILAIANGLMLLTIFKFPLEEVSCH